MTVSQMSLTEMTDSPQQRQHWLGEQVLNWSRLPVVHVRATAFLQHPFFLDWAAESIARDATIRLPFGAGKTSPIDARDVAEVIATILASPTGHVGKVYELTGPRSQDMHAVAAEYSAALGRTVTYIDVPFEQWRDQELRARHLPDHLFEHLITMARLHADNRYDRFTPDVEAITGRPATSVRDFVAQHGELFGRKNLPTKESERSLDFLTGRSGDEGGGESPSTNQNRTTISSGPSSPARSTSCFPASKARCSRPLIVTPTIGLFSGWRKRIRILGGRFASFRSTLARIVSLAAAGR